MGQGKAEDVLLDCKCKWHMKGNKTFILSEIELEMYLSSFCQECAVGECAWHPGDLSILVLQKGGRTESPDLFRLFRSSGVLIYDTTAAC